MSNIDIEDIYKWLKKMGFKKTLQTGVVKSGRKEYRQKELRRYIEDEKDIEISRIDTDKVLDLFFIRRMNGRDGVSFLYELYNQDDTYYFLDYNGKTNQLSNIETFKSISDVHKTVLKTEVQNHTGSDSQEVENSIRIKSRSSKFRYEPYNPHKFYKKGNGEDILNMYIPPTHFFKKQEVDKPPEPIWDFLVHLFDNQEPDLTYCLDWLTTMLEKKNGCYMTLIGEQGVGKNTLVDWVCEPLVGTDNFGVVSNTRLNKEFTNFLEGNQLIHFSETNLDDEGVLNKLKLFQDNIIEIERKGIDTYKTENFVNGIITSNDDHKIRIQPGERRYSFLKLTSIPLNESELIKKYGGIEGLKEEIGKSISQFYWWLKSREVDRMMSKPFINEKHRDNIFEMSLTRQESRIVSYIDKLCQFGDSLTLSNIEKHLQEEFRHNTMKPTKIYKFLQQYDKVLVSTRERPIDNTKIKLVSPEKRPEPVKEEPKTISLTPLQVVEKYGVKTNE